MVDAMRRLPADVTLLAIHPEPDEAIRAELGDRVRFTGYVPAEGMSLYYSAADLHCFPTVYGGFGLVLVEGMACGCPAVVFDYPAMNEIVDPGCGYLVREPTAEAYAAAIMRALADRRAKREAAIRRAHDFEMDRQIDKLVALYEDVLCRSRDRVAAVEAVPRRDRSAPPAVPATIGIRSVPER